MTIVPRKDQESGDLCVYTHHSSGYAQLSIFVGCSSAILVEEEPYRLYLLFRSVRGLVEYGGGTENLVYRET